MMLVSCDAGTPQWKFYQLGEVRRVEVSVFGHPAATISTQKERHVRSQCPTISSSRMTVGGKTLSLLEMRGTGLTRVNQVVATLPDGDHASVVCDHQAGVLRCPVVSEVQELYLGFSTSGVIAACVGTGYSLTGPL
jgi:hypothetical protein